MKHVNDRIKAAMGGLRANGPRNLRQYLSGSSPDLPRASKAAVDKMLDVILGSDANVAEVQLFENLLRDWDNANDGEDWVQGTARNTPERRARIHALLASGTELAKRIDEQVPFISIQPTTVIAREIRDWYKPQDGVDDYYWGKYRDYLHEVKHWEKASILSLANSTEAIMTQIANPRDPATYAARGLVVGYVQSGKTANFTGLIARAADAGYRYVIVLAGTWNILRAQTQRRIDKELIGKEQLADDAIYTDQIPVDWDEFLSHGFNPVDRNHFGWTRITRFDHDYKKLHASLEALELDCHDRNKPIFHPSNLRRSKTKLIVLKKLPGIINKLCSDLSKITSNRHEISALVIDDESDQAGLNTRKPPEPGSTEAKQRTETNNAILKLLKLLPRAQYVGYTATPYANALVDPNDTEDLFPKDFIVPLERPLGYMGISDFFDAEKGYDDLDKQDFTEKEIAYIRRIDKEHGDDSEELKTAIRSFVLAGAVKLFRGAKNKKLKFKHHTMLVHTSSKRNEHKKLFQRIKKLWVGCAFSTPNGREALRKLWEEDFVPVSASQPVGQPMPKSFGELLPFISDAIEKIVSDQHFVLILNSDKDSAKAPDFSAHSVWKIIVGGNKLSRGYTLEDLTVSYYRRNVGAGDALMQMGRWFGFRHGYQDLVRVFMSVSEGAGGRVDLVERFKSACRMEDKFREELRRYAKPEPGKKRIRPQDIPPLVAMIGELPPTAKNKMFNAIIESRNFGGRWSMPTLVAGDAKGARKNIDLMLGLMQRSGRAVRYEQMLGGRSDLPKDYHFDAHRFAITNDDLIWFLENFTWLRDEYPAPKKPSEIQLQIEFLKMGKKHGITSWQAYIPQRKDSFGDPIPAGKGVSSIKVKKRGKVDDRVFGVFGERGHRIFARWLTKQDQGQAKEDKEYLVSPAKPEWEKLRDAKVGIMMLYPAREMEESKEVYLGYELLFPDNDLGYQTSFTVKRKDAEDKVVVGKDD